MGDVINFMDWKEKDKSPEEDMAETLHKTLSPREALEYVAFAVFQLDLPKDYDGNVTCELNSDGSVDVYTTPKEIKESPLN